MKDKLQYLNHSLPNQLWDEDIVADHLFKMTKWMPILHAMGIKQAVNGKSDMLKYEIMTLLREVEHERTNVGYLILSGGKLFYHHINICRLYIYKSWIH